jgi:hypothetical protein
MTISIATISIMTLELHEKNVTQSKTTLILTTLEAYLSAIMLTIVYAECHN